MLYVLIGEDAPNALDKRLAARGEHVARLQALQADGRLVLAGPCPAIDANDPGPAGFTGSVGGSWYWNCTFMPTMLS